MKRQLLTVISALTLLAACAGDSARETVRSGMLELDLPQQAFLDVWGKPDRTGVISGEEAVQFSSRGPYS